MTEIIKGREIADKIYERLRKESDDLKEKGIDPVLAVFQVGKKPEDEAYKRSILNGAKKAGVDVRELGFPESASTDDVLSMINIVNGSRKIHGILILRPLPPDMDEAGIIEAVSPQKDMDGCTGSSMISLYRGRGEGHGPCTAEAVMEIIRSRIEDLKGKKAVVIGRSTVIGKPVAMMLLRADATVTICHSGSGDIGEILEGADIIVAAAGRPEVVKGPFREGQMVIDVGINEVDHRLVGDVDMAAAEGVVAYITPVPGGLGSVTSAVLMDHVIQSAAAYGVAGEEPFIPDEIDKAQPGFF